MYIAIEGADGTGKDVQGERLYRRLAKTHTPTLLVHEPDDTLPPGQLLRQMLKDGSYREAHAAMFLAARMALLATKVRPVLDAGGTARHSKVSLRGRSL